MTTEYKVTVTKIEKDVPFKDKEYVVTGKDSKGANTYDYKYFDSTQDIDSVIYSQNVEELDLQKLVQVVIEKIK